MGMSITDSELVVLSSNDDKVLAVPLSKDSVIFPTTKTVVKTRILAVRETVIERKNNIIIQRKINRKV
jgi:hypothetical protein